MKKYYYSLHVMISKSMGYTIAVSSDTKLDTIEDKKEIIELAIYYDCFNEVTDYHFVDEIKVISQEAFNEISLYNL